MPPAVPTVRHEVALAALAVEPMAVGGVVGRPGEEAEGGSGRGGGRRLEGCAHTSTTKTDVVHSWGGGVGGVGHGGGWGEATKSASTVDTEGVHLRQHRQRWQRRPCWGEWEVAARGRTEVTPTAGGGWGVRLVTGGVWP